MTSSPPISIVLDTTTLWPALRDAALPWNSTSSDPPNSWALPGGFTLDLIHADEALVAAFMDVAFTDFLYDLFADADVDDPYEVLEGLMEDIDEIFEEMRGQAALVFGPPSVTWTLADTPGDGTDAFCLARWEVPNAVVTLRGQHDDKELPVRLMLVLEPPANRASIKASTEAE